MCFGGKSGPSAEDIYEEKYKVEPEPLPSLKVEQGKERQRKMKDVQRKGAPRRSLLNPMMGGDYGCVMRCRKSLML